MEAGTVAITRAFSQRRLEDRIAEMKNGATYLSQNPKLAFQQKAVDEEIELLKLQQELENKYGEPVFIDTSVSETIFKLVELAGKREEGDAVRSPFKFTREQRSALLADANRVMKLFKVPEKRFWHLKVKALARSEQWELLKQFAQDKKSPIGYAPFAKACIEKRLPPDMVSPFIEKIPNLEDRYGLFMQINLWNKAIECAHKLKDRHRLLQVKALCKDPRYEKAVDQILSTAGI